MRVKYLLSSIVLVCPAITLACLKTDWTFFSRNRKYLIVSDERVDCLSAYDICEKMGGQSLIIPDLQTSLFVQKLLKGQNCSFPRWIGLNNLNTGDYLWVDGTPLGRDDFSNWKSESRSTNITCVAIVSCRDGRWEERNPEDKLRYICEATDPCASRPVLSVGSSVERLENTTVTFTSEQEVEITCSLRGYSGLVTNVSLFCENLKDEVVGTEDVVVSQRIFVNEKVDSKKCVCASFSKNGRREKSDATMLFKNDLQLSTELFNEVSLAVGANSSIVAGYLKKHGILSQLDIVLTRIDLAVETVTGQNILNIVSLIVECCIDQFDSDSRQQFLGYIKRVASGIPFLDDQSFAFESTEIALSVHAATAQTAVLMDRLVLLKSQSPRISIMQVEDTKLALQNDAQRIQEQAVPARIPMRAITESLTNADKTKMKRVIAAFFKDDRLFGPGLNYPNGTIVGSVILIEFPGLSMNINIVDDRINLTFYTQKRNVKCVFWDPDSENQYGGRGNWESFGCTILNYDLEFVTCSCSHMTSFALFLTPDDVDVTEHAPSLDLLSIVGCLLSAIGLSLTLLTYLIFPYMRADEPSIILIHLCSALLMVNVLFITNVVVVSVSGRSQEILIVCKAVAILSHYCMLSSLLWMSCDAYYLYLAMAYVFIDPSKNYLLLFIIISWGAPFLIVLVTAADHSFNNYGLLFNALCWIKTPAFYYTFVLPACLLILFNYFIFGIVMNYLRLASRSDVLVTRQKSIKKQLKGAASLSSLLGLAWIFGILSIGIRQVVLSYLFVIFNSLQGFFIFFFFCLLKESVRESWSRLIWK